MIELGLDVHHALLRGAGIVFAGYPNKWFSGLCLV